MSVERTADKHGGQADRQTDEVFVDVTDSPLQNDLREGPGVEIQHESADYLAETRVDLEDEIIGEPSKLTGQEIAVLRPNKTIKKEGEASEL